MICTYAVINVNIIQLLFNLKEDESSDGSQEQHLMLIFVNKKYVKMKIISS